MQIRNIKEIMVIFENIITGYGYIKDFKIKKDDNKITLLAKSGLTDDMYNTKIELNEKMQYSGSYTITREKDNKVASSGEFEFTNVLTTSPLHMLIIKRNGDDKLIKKTYYKNKRDEFVLVENDRNLEIKYVDDEEYEKKRTK